MAARTIHPFPARMAPDIAIKCLSTVSTSDSMVVLDPMCGSGTVLAAASALGHTAHGFDVDPLAVLMSRVATQPVSTSALIAEATHVIENAELSSVDTLPWDDSETITFAEYWFGASQRKQLGRLSRALLDVEDVRVREALQIALSRIIVTKAPKASLAADTSHSRPHRRETESTYDVYQGFAKSVIGLVKLLDQRVITGESVVRGGDARSLDVQDESVDLVITSPPYLNAIDYLRGHKMSLIWLGYSISELRKIRSNSIGAERALSSDAADQANEMVASVLRTVETPEKLPLGTITRYAHDLTLFARELIRVCKVGAKVVTVIGNSTLRGNFIRNEDFVSMAYQHVGFQMSDRLERELPENRRYLPVDRQDKSSALGKRMRTEVILTASRP